MIAKQLISETPKPASNNTLGSDILFMLDEYRIDSLPVVDDGKLIGSIVESDIFLMDDIDLPISNRKSKLKEGYVLENTHLLDVVKAMCSYKLSVLPVMDEHEIYLGCIDRNTVLDSVSKMLEVRNPGAIIVLEVNQNDFVLSQIAQIVESQDSKILNLFVTHSDNSTITDVVIKINSREIQAILQAFNRYNYIVKATYTEDEKMHDDLRDRYDSFMRYLNV